MAPLNKDTISFKGRVDWVTNAQWAHLIQVTLKNLNKLGEEKLPQKIARNVKNSHVFGSAPLSRMIADPLGEVCGVIGQAITGNNTGKEVGSLAPEAVKVITEVADDGLKGLTRAINPLSFIKYAFPSKRYPNEEALVQASNKVVKHIHIWTKSNNLPHKPLAEYNPEELQRLNEKLPELAENILTNPAPRKPSELKIGINRIVKNVLRDLSNTGVTPS
ncbi:MAG: hypothetical protein A2Y25_06825 [Candidatus Melainabacteria bacterium GWF2_37_15]|nr:MAG: hypothetical protein A2Y25_06825 [Candidatus Melainabacteria bacterium GWF2_37_15]